MSIDIDFKCDLDLVEQDRVFAENEYFEHSNFQMIMKYYGLKIVFNSGISSITSDEIRNFLHKIENNFGSSNISFNGYNGSILSCDSNGNFYLQVYTCKECCFTTLDISIKLEQQSFHDFINIIKKLLNFSEKFENLNFENDEVDENGEEIISNI